MTTIAYKSGVIASDTLVTHGDIRVGTSRHKIAKWTNSAGEQFLAGISGEFAKAATFLAWLQSDQQGAAPPMRDGTNIMIDAFMVTQTSSGDRHLTVFVDDGETILMDDGPFALGTGGVAARAAMAIARVGAEEAVAAAIAVDLFSGGDVVVFGFDQAAEGHTERPHRAAHRGPKFGLRPDPANRPLPPGERNARLHLHPAPVRSLFPVDNPKRW